MKRDAERPQHWMTDVPGYYVENIVQPLDDIHVGSDGACDWADIAKARDEVRRRIEDAHRAEQRNIRDWFAGQALTGIASGYWSNPDMSGLGPRQLADEAYVQADAMLAARESQP